VVIRRGVIDRQALDKLCLSLSDLLEGLRSAGFLDPEDVGTAIVEANGTISAFETELDRPPKASELNLNPPYEGLPLLLVMDGRIQKANLRESGRDEAWLCGLLGWGVRHIEDEALTEEVRGRIMGKMLDALTAALPPADAPMALTTLDWLNGRRHPMGCDQLRSCISGLSLGTDAPELFRSLIFATAFGSKRILEGFGQMGAEIERVMAVGGIAKKSPYIMQVLADVFEKPVYVLESSQACALGAAMAAAVACGAYGDLLAAQKGMASAVHAQYRPDASRAELYRTRYERYLALGGFAENFRVKE